MHAKLMTSFLNWKKIKKSKGRIQKIDWKEHTEEIKRIWEGKPLDKLVEKWKEQGLRGNHPERYYNGASMLARINKIKLLVGYSSNLVGLCSECKRLNTYFKTKE